MYIFVYTWISIYMYIVLKILCRVFCNFWIVAKRHWTWAREHHGRFFHDLFSNENCRSLCWEDSPMCFFYIHIDCVLYTIFFCSTFFRVSSHWDEKRMKEAGKSKDYVLSRFVTSFLLWPHSNPTPEDFAVYSIFIFVSSVFGAIFVCSFSLFEQGEQPRKNANSGNFSACLRSLWRLKGAGTQKGQQTFEPNRGVTVRLWQENYYEDDSSR